MKATNRLSHLPENSLSPITLLQPPGEACRGGCYAFEKHTVSQKASLRRKEVRRRTWARSALKLAKVAGVIPCARLVSNRSSSIALRTARSVATTVARDASRPRGGPGYEARQRKYPVRPVSE